MHRRAFPGRARAVSRYVGLEIPTLGQHGQDVDIDGAGTSPSVVTLNTQASRSTFLAFLGGAWDDNADPVDSKGNALAQLGSNQGYAGGLWPGFGFQAFGLANGVGGSSHSISVTKSHADWEISTIFIEVLGGRSIVTNQGSAAAAGAGVPYSSPTITVNGPALLIALVSGDGDAATPDQSYTVGSGWNIFRSDFRAATAYVPFAFAMRAVGAAGTYSTTWTPAVSQGASMFMIGIQA